jgi:hypothetical protein
MPQYIRGNALFFYGRIGVLHMNVVDRVYHYGRYALAKMGLSLCCRFGWHEASARFMKLLMYSTVRGESGHSKRILLLAKSGFNEDMQAAFAQKENVDLLFLHRDALKFVARQYLPASLNDNNYNIGGSLAEAKSAYRTCLRAIWEIFIKKNNLSVVISGNFGYYAERELAFALEELNAPLLVAHKECLKTPSQVRAWIHVYNRYRGRFGGRSIAVYNETEKAVLVEGNVCLSDRISVVGCPRLDTLHRMRKNREHSSFADSRRKTLLFFSFHPTAASGLPWVPMPAEVEGIGSFPVMPIGGNAKYLNYWFGFDAEGRSTEPVYWDKLSREVHRGIIELAARRDDIDVVIKVKVGPHNTSHAEQMLEGPLPQNIKVFRGGSSEQFFQSASVVCAFNSTACLEAIAAGIPVVTPWFCEAGEPAAADHLVDIRGAAIVADRPRALISEIEALLDAPNAYSRELTPRQRDVLDFYMGNVDGRAGERFVEFVKSSIA